MKKIKYSAVLLICALILVLIPACKKYEDGPIFSLRTKTERLSNTWKLENYTINGADFTSLVSSYTETFTKDKNYSYNWGILDAAGKWAFQNNSKEVKLSGDKSIDGRVLFILKLEEKTLWYYYMDGNTKIEMHMVQK